MHFCVSFFPYFVGSAMQHIIEALNCFRLRLGFDLFSHSFHNLIKRLWFCCATEVVDGMRNNKRKSPFMDEGGWKDEHLHCVCRLEVKCYSIYASLTSAEKVFTCRESREFQKTFHLWPALNWELLCHKCSIPSHKTCDWCKFFHLNHVIRVCTSFRWNICQVNMKK